MTRLALLVAVVFSLVACGGESRTPSARSATARYRTSLGWSIRYPRAMHVEHSAAVSGNGHYAVSETTFASFRSKPGVRHRISSRGESIGVVSPSTKSGLFPSNGVALRVEDEQTPFPRRGGRPGTTRLPLRLSQFHKAPALHGWTGPQPLLHSLVAEGQSYTIQVWIGRRASTQQRALLDRMLASISAHRVPAQP